MAKPPVWIPQELTLDDFARDVRPGPGRAAFRCSSYFRNSLVISLTSTVIALLIGMAGGYAFARYRFRGKCGDLPRPDADPRRAGHRAVAAALHHLRAGLGIIDTHFGLILVYVALNVPFTIWLIDGFFRQVPKDLAEAAQIDGCTRWQAFWKVEFPLGRAGHRGGRHLRLPDLVERICAGQPADPLGQLARPCRSACWISPRSSPSTGRGMCALAVVMIIPALILTFIVQKHLDRRADLRRRERIRHGRRHRCKKLVKRYGALDVVHGIDLDIAAPANSSCWSARRAAASPPRCG